MWERGEIRVGDEGLWTRRGMKMVFWMMCLRSRQTQTLDIKRSSNACLVNRIEMKSMEGREARVERWFATGMRLVLPSLPRSPPPAPFSRLGLVKERQVDLIRIQTSGLPFEDSTGFGVGDGYGGGGGGDVECFGAVVVLG